MPARARRGCDHEPTATPSNSIDPLLAGSSPESMLIKVDLPAPLVPITAWISPMRRLSETESTAVRPPKRRVNFFARSSSSAMCRASARHQARLQSDQPLGKQRDKSDDRQAQGQLPMRSERAKQRFELEQFSQQRERYRAYHCAAQAAD